jgi:hypothetical protein
MTMPNIPRLPRTLLAGAVALAGLAVAQPAHAQQVTPTSALHNPDGTLAGFVTTEPSLYFLAPASWSPVTNSATPPVRLTSATVAGQAVYDLRLVLSPDYARDAPTVVATRGQDAHALFFPLPMTIEHVTLFLPQALGSVAAELVPDETGMTTPVALYYRLRFNTEQLGVLRTLAHSGLTLQGTVEYSYLAPGGSARTAAPMTIILHDADLAVSSSPPPDPTAWLAGLLSMTELSASGVLDGLYALGGGVAIQISQSRIDAQLLPNTWQLRPAGDNTIQIQPTWPEDLAGTIAFDVVQFGVHIRVDYRAAFAASLDLAFMRLTITEFDVTTVTVNGSSSPFLTALLKKLMQDPSVQARASEALSDALQRRILSQTLFTLGDVLP